MKKILILLLINSCLLFAQDAGKTGLSFLKYGFGARNVALGNLGVVASNDVTSLYYNPSILANLDRSELMFTHNEWIQDVRSEMLGASFKLWGLPIAVGINTTSISDIPVRIGPSPEPDSKFNANFFSGSISTGFNLVNDISIGFTAKYLYENILSDDASGMGYDVGLFYKSPIEGLSFGTAIRNMGSMKVLRNVSTKLPTDISFGSIYSFFNDKLNSNFAVSAGIQKYTDVDEMHINFGGEVFYNDLIAFRTGYQYQSKFESKGITAGLGLKYRSIYFDYAFIPYSFNLGTTHSISIKLKI